MFPSSFRFDRLRPSILLFLVLLLGGATAQAEPQVPEAARPLVRAGLEAMGGEATLRAVRTIRLKGVGHTNLLEQSERPQGPWIRTYEQIVDVSDLDARKNRSETEARWVQSPEWRGPTVIVADGAAAIVAGRRAVPAPATFRDDALVRLFLGPERILLTAAAAEKLSLGDEVLLQGVPHRTLEFPWGEGRVRVYLNRYTYLPTAVDILRAYPDDNYLGIWGDLSVRILYSLWSLRSGGLRFPLQWDYQVHGQLRRSITWVEVELNPALGSNVFSISPEIRDAFRASLERRPTRRTVEPGQGFGSREEIVEIVPGVVQIPGWWNVTLVDQGDGLVIIESPLSSEYSSKIFEEAGRRFPNRPVKALITTSDAWPHFGGLREYLARGVPVYALDLNEPILRRLAEAAYTSYPDRLETESRPADFHWVDSRLSLGKSKNRVEIYPIRTESGERMMMVYFPEHRLLYAADLIQKMPDGSFFWLQFLAEVQEAVRRENLQVETVFAMHLPPTPWEEIQKALAQMMAAPVGSGNP